MVYISTSDANTYLETSDEDTNIASLILQAENLINRYCGVSWLWTQTITNERHKYYWVWPYYLKNIPINSITHINGSAITLTEWTDYMATGRKVIFNDTVDTSQYNTTFWYITFTYTCGYASIPDAVKQACLMIVAWLYNYRKSVWVTQFTQWDLSISLANNWVLGLSSDELNNIRMLLAPYKIVNVVS